MGSRHGRGSILISSTGDAREGGGGRGRCNELILRCAPRSSLGGRLSGRGFALGLFRHFPGRVDGEVRGGPWQRLR